LRPCDGFGDDILCSHPVVADGERIDVTPSVAQRVVDELQALLRTLSRREGVVGNPRPSRDRLVAEGAQPLSAGVIVFRLEREHGGVTAERPDDLELLHHPELESRRCWEWHRRQHRQHPRHATASCTAGATRSPRASGLQSNWARTGWVSTGAYPSRLAARASGPGPLTTRTTAVMTWP